MTVVLPAMIVLSIVIPIAAAAAPGAEPVVISVIPLREEEADRSEAGWDRIHVQLNNSGPASVRGALVANGFNSNNWRPVLRGERYFPPRVIEPAEPVDIVALLPRDWERVELAFVAADGERLSRVDRGDTSVVPTGFDFGKNVMLLSTDANWRAQIQQVLKLSSIVVNDIGVLPTRRLASSVVIDLESYAPDSEPLLRRTLEKCVEDGISVIVTTTRMNGPLRPAIASYFQSGGLPSSRSWSYSTSDGSNETIEIRDGDRGGIRMLRTDHRIGSIQSGNVIFMIQSNSELRIRLASNDVPLDPSSPLDLYSRVRSAPPSNAVSYLLGFYALAVVPLAYFVLTRRKRRDLAWIVLPCLGVACSGAIFLMGLAAHGAADRIAVYDVVRHRTPPDAGDSAPSQAVRDVYVSCFSATPGDKQFSVGRAAAAGVLSEYDDISAGAITIAPSGDSGLTLSAPIDFWSPRSFHFFGRETAAPPNPSDFEECYRFDWGRWFQRVGDTWQISSPPFVSSIIAAYPGPQFIGVRRGIAPDVAIDRRANVKEAYRVDVWPAR